MRRLVTGSLKTAADTVVLPLGDSLSFIGLSGTYGTAVVVVEGSADGTKWNPIEHYRSDTLYPLYDNQALTDNTTYGWNVPHTGMVKIRVRLVSISSGTVAVSMVNGPGKLPITEQGKITQLLNGVALVVANVATGAGAADVVVTTGPGIVHRVNATATATAAFSLYDHATSSSGLSPLYTSASNIAQGTLVELNIPFTKGLIYTQGNASPLTVVGYSPV